MGRMNPGKCKLCFLPDVCSKMGFCVCLCFHWSQWAWIEWSLPASPLHPVEGHKRSPEVNKRKFLVPYMQEKHFLHAYPREHVEASRPSHLQMTKHPNEALVSSLWRGTVNQMNSFLPQLLWSQYFIPAIATRTRMVGESYTNLCVEGQGLRMQLEVILT